MWEINLQKGRIQGSMERNRALLDKGFCSKCSGNCNIRKSPIVPQEAPGRLSLWRINLIFSIFPKAIVSHSFSNQKIIT